VSGRVLERLGRWSEWLGGHHHVAGRDPTSVAILTTATHKYIRFVPDFYESCRTYLLPGTPKHHFVMTDQVEHAFFHGRADVTAVYTEHRPWPFPTLLRFKYIASIASRLQPFSHLIAIDADTRVCSLITERAFFRHGKPLFGVQHPGFVGKRGSFETDARSRACVGPNDDLSVYRAGGMWGGTTPAALELAAELAARIDDDLARGVIAVWHDESHLNKYFCENARRVHTHNPGYMYPESWRLFYRKRILALDKNHSAMRDLDGGHG